MAFRKWGSEQLKKLGVSRTIFLSADLWPPWWLRFWVQFLLRFWLPFAARSACAARNSGILADIKRNRPTQIS